MNTESNALNQICKDVKKQIEAEYRDLQLVFIAHKHDNRKRTFELMRLEIEDHPEGKKTYEMLGQELDKLHNQSQFFGIIEGTQTKFLLLKRQVWQAIIFINIDQYDNKQNGHYDLYHYVYHALALYQHYHNEEKEFFVKKDNLIKPVGKLPVIMRANMLADVFAALMCEFSGEKNAVRGLAKKRCEMTVNAVPDFRAEFYPYPITLDATLLVLSDVLQVEGMPIKPAAKALEIAEEVSFTFDDKALKQWWSFARLAQQMAWMHFDHKQILGLATYTNEDAYMRSTAYLVAETMNTDPQAPANLSYFNPFTEDEVNERLHKKLADQALAQAIRSATESNYRPGSFDEVISNLHISFFDGRPIAGWCIPALLAAARALEEEEENPLKKGAAQRAFKEEFSKLPWPLIQGFWEKITLRRRAGMEMNKSNILAIAFSDEETKDLGNILEEILPDDIVPETKTMPKPSPIGEIPPETKIEELKISDLEIED